jgi:hypothetical protein
MRDGVVSVLVLLVVLLPAAAFAGTYQTDFDESDVGELSPAAFFLSGGATASIGGSQLTLNDANGLGFLAKNAFALTPSAPAPTFASGLDITVVLDAATIEGMKTVPGAWSGIILLGAGENPTVVFGPCGQMNTTFLATFLIPGAQWPPGPCLAVGAINRLGGNRIPWSTPLAATPADTTLRVVVDDQTPPNATFYVDGSPVLTNFPIGPNQMNVVGVVQQGAITSPAITTTLESFRVSGDEVPPYPPFDPGDAVSTGSYVGLGVMALVLAVLAAYLVRKKAAGARA